MPVSFLTGICALSCRTVGSAVLLQYVIKKDVDRKEEKRYSGGYSSEVPPLPIPNREVKLTHADGTAIQCGRVGSRRF